MRTLTLPHSNCSSAIPTTCRLRAKSQSRWPSVDRKLSQKLVSKHWAGRVSVGRCNRQPVVCCASEENGKDPVDSVEKDGRDVQDGPEGPSTDLNVIFARLQKLALPYWTSSEVAVEARWRLAGVIALTVATTGVSVVFSFLGRDFFNALSERNPEAFTLQLIKYLGGFVVGIPIFVFSDYFQVVVFNFLGRDFFNALSEKDAEAFTYQLTKYLGGFAVGIPIFVLRSYFRSKLSLEWREWMTEQFLSEYLSKKTFYQVQATAAVDNPDQRISSDVKVFTDSALGFVLTILNAVIDLVSFSEILFSIYPPLFVALVVYSVGGTGISLWLGRSLVGLNFQQEAREADFRYGLVRLRENAESIAFYGGQKKEQNLVVKRLSAAVGNFGDLLIASRNLEFFTSFYRFLIQLLPAAVVAPLFFRGEIEFGVVTQSQSAFAHILNDVSLVVYQLEALAGFSAVVDRLGEFQEVMDTCNEEDMDKEGPDIELTDAVPERLPTEPLLEIDTLTLLTPGSGTKLIQDLTMKVLPGQSLLIMGPSGVGKTSLLRAIAGLWSSGSGHIKRYGTPIGNSTKDGDIMFVPQRPYVVLGTLRDQLLYPTWSESPTSTEESTAGENGDGGEELVVAGVSARPVPSDLELEEAMRKVRLGDVLQRCQQASTNPLDLTADWSTQLSLGEQQRLAFARVLLANPRLVLMDESTSALDVQNERALYKVLKESSITFVSVGHRPTLQDYHTRILEILPADDTQEGVRWSMREAVPASV